MVNSKVYRMPPPPGQAPEDAGKGIATDDAGTALTFAVPENARAGRLDAFLCDSLREEGFSREKIKQAVASGLVSCNGTVVTKSSAVVRPGDTVTATLPSPAQTLAPEQGELAIIWQDGHLAVLNKPANLTTHPAPGRPEGTLAHRLLHHFPQLALQGGLRPGIVHRLDMDTSGLMLAALTEKARLAMSGAFAARAVTKEYLALVHGVPEKPSGSITAPIGRSPANKTKMAVVPVLKGGREARSEYTVLRTDPDGRFSLVKVALHTGRTHQIRVHMQSIGHPLLGDATYKLPNLPPLPGPMAPRQMLHAFSLGFTHPVTAEELAFTAPPPEDFTSLALALFTPMQRVIITGSPGGGKSALTRAFQDAALPVWNADEAVKRLYARDGDGWHMLKSRYGARFAPEDAAGVDKKALFAAMAHSSDFRREVERLIHPLVFHDLERFWHEQALRGARTAAAEIPLALESGRYDPSKRAREGLAGRRREILAGVYAPFAKRRERMMATRGWSAEIVAQLESWQWPEKKKVKAVDLVVDNSGTIDDLRRRSGKVLGVLAFLRQQTGRRTQAALEALWGKAHR